METAKKLCTDGIARLSVPATGLLRRFEIARASQAFGNLRPFATSYLCETGFSAIAIIRQSIARR